MIAKKPLSSLIEISEMKIEDLGEIMAIEKVSFPTPWSENMFRKELRVKMSTNLVAWYGGRKGKEIAGYMNFWTFADEVHLNNIAVRKDYQGKGVASKLMEEMIKRSWHIGALWATLEVRSGNRAAIALYQKYGYVVKGRRPNYYEDSNEDALIMWCDLKESAKRILSDEP